MTETATAIMETTESRIRPRAQRINILILGATLTIFLSLTYFLCLLIGIMFPHMPLSHTFVGFFVSLSEVFDWYDLLIGLIEAVLAGWYFAAVFGMLYNIIVARFDQ